jgi:hypothetical protein
MADRKIHWGRLRWQCFQSVKHQDWRAGCRKEDNLLFVRFVIIAKLAKNPVKNPPPQRRHLHLRLRVIKLDMGLHVAAAQHTIKILQKFQPPTPPKLHHL